MMSGNKFDQELKMVKNALDGERGKDALKEYLRPLIEDIAEKYIIAGNKIKKVSREELIKAGWAHFDFALRKYYENIEYMDKPDNNMYFFTTYFTWYVRQGIVEYLNSLK
jgi:hypothetical protein